MLFYVGHWRKFWFSLLGRNVFGQNCLWKTIPLIWIFIHPWGRLHLTNVIFWSLSSCWWWEWIVWGKHHYHHHYHHHNHHHDHHHDQDVDVMRRLSENRGRNISSKTFPFSKKHLGKRLFTRSLHTPPKKTNKNQARKYFQWFIGKERN